VLVVGMTGAGKTSAARRIAARIDAPFHEMDALAIGPGWSTPPDLVHSVESIVAGPSWVFDSFGYEQVRDVMWAAADTIIWLDYPARVIFARVLRRSLHRTLHRTEVFGGNIETWRSWLSSDHPVWWAMRQVRTRRTYLARRTQSVGAAHLRTVRLVSPGEFERWLARQPGTTGGPEPL
jgi:adenylate kinase family enzyme